MAHLIIINKSLSEDGHQREEEKQLGNLH